MSTCFHILKQVNCSKFIVKLHKMYLKVKVDENSHKLMRTFYCEFNMAAISFKIINKRGHLAM